MSAQAPTLTSNEQKRIFLDALESAIFRGVEYFSYDGNQLKYRSFDEMKELRAMLRSELGLGSPVPRRSRARRAVIRY